MVYELHRHGMREANNTLLIACVVRDRGKPQEKAEKVQTKSRCGYGCGCGFVRMRIKTISVA